MAQTIKLKRSATQGATPTTSQLALGEVAINTYDGKMYIKKDVGGTESIVEIGTGSGGSGLASSFTLYEYTATANQTTFSGSDSNSNTLAYDTGTPPKILVYLNGVLLDHTTDYTATSGTSVVLTTGAAAGDLVQVAAYKSTVSTTLDIDLTDNQKLLLGTDDDLEIYHDGSNGFIKNTTGDLYIQDSNGSIRIQPKTGESGINVLADSAVELYYDNSKKLETTSTGATVTGTLAADQLKVGATERIYLDGGSNTFIVEDAADDLGIYVGGSRRLRVNTARTVATGDLQVAGGDIEFNQSSGQARIRNLLQDTYMRFQVNVGGTQTNAINIRGNNGYVGIGSAEGGSSPVYPFDVYAASADTVARFTSGDNKARLLLADNDTEVFVIAEGSKMSLGAASSLSSTNLTIDSSGNVGIGTTSPSEKLEVNGRLKVQAGDAATSAYSIISNGGDLVLKAGADDVVLRTGGSGSEGIYFQDGAQDTKMFINAENGNVGIGTSSPNRVLNVEGTPTTFGDTQSVLQIADDTAMAAGVGGGLLFTGKSLTGQGDSNTVFAGIHGEKENGTSGNTSGAMVFSTRTSGSNPAERMRIDSAGNVCIGNTTAGAKLDIRQDSGFAVRIENSSGHYFRVAAGGAIDVGGSAFVDANRNITAGTISSGAITSTGALAGTVLRIDGNTAINQDGSGTYMILYDGGGGAALYAGNTSDNRNYYQSNHHRFRSDDANTNFAEISSVGMIIGDSGPETNMGKLHVKDSDSGATPYQNGNGGVTIERNGRAALNFLTPNTQDAYVFFGDPESANAGYVGYEHSTDVLVIKSGGYVKTTGSGLNVNTGNLQMGGTEVIDSSRNIAAGTISSGNITTSGYLAGPATFTIDPAAVGDNTGTVVIAGNLQVDGTTTTINSTTLTVDDLNITLASGSANSAAANGAGITVDCGSGTDATITYNGTLDTWEFNKELRLTTGSFASPVNTGRYLKYRSAYAAAAVADFELKSDNNTAAVARITGTGTADLLQVFDNTSQVFTIKDGGKVGIGTNSPSAPLSLLDASLTTQGTGEGGLRVHRPNAASQYGYFDYGYNEGGVNIGSLYTGGGASAFGTFTFRQHSSGSSQIPMFIDDTGNVGIGTTSPAKTLDVAANGTNQGIHLNISNVGRLHMYADGDRNYFKGLSGNGHRFTTTGGALVEIQNGGNVGIGTSSPGRKLTVQGTSDAYIKTDATSHTSWTIGSDTYGFLVYDDDVGGIDGYRIVVRQNSGNVGVGTTQPQAKFQVEEAGIETTTTSTSATTQVAIDTFAAATFRSARYTIQVTNSTDSTYHITEILLIHDGTTPQITEYGTIFTGSAEATFDADISSSNVRLLATPATTDSMTFKVVRHCITV